MYKYKQLMTSLKSSLKYFFLTIKFHPQDVLLFDDYIGQLNSLLEDDVLIWCIENDNTPDRHYHAVIPNIIRTKSYKDRDKMKTFLIPRLRKYLKDKYNQTEIDNTGRTKALNLSDVLEPGFLNKEGKDKVGYCAKEFTYRCGGTITPEEKEKHKLIYLNSLKITEKKIKNTIEIKTLTIKTAFVYMYDFYKTYLPPVNSIFSSMTYDGYDFTQISGNQKDQLRNQLKLTASKNEISKFTKREIKDAEQEIDNIPHRNIYQDYDDLTTDLANLIDVFKFNKQTSIPIEQLEKLLEQQQNKHMLI